MGKKTRKVPDEILQFAEAHPESTYINLGGERLLFLLNGYGMKLAREQGHDPVPAIFNALSSMAPAVMESVQSIKGKIDMKKGVDLRESDFTPTVILDIVTKAVTGQFFEDVCLVVWWGILTGRPDMSLGQVQVLMTPAGAKKVFEKVWPRMMRYVEDLEEEDILRDESEDGGDESGE